METNNKKPNNSMEKFDREKLLKYSEQLIESLHTKLSAKRFRANKDDSTRLSYARALIQALQCHNSILKDEQLEDIERRLIALEDEKNGHTYN